MKIRGDIYLLIGIMACALAYGLTALSYPDLKTKLVPGAVGGMVFLLAAIQLVKELTQKKPPVPETPVEEEATGGDDEDFSDAPVGWRENLGSFGWLLGFLAGIYLVGFLISTLVFVLAFMKYSRFGWGKSIVTAVLATATIYGVFEVVLSANLFPGIIVAALLG